jgi:hypothetical protein
VITEDPESKEIVRRTVQNHPEVKTHFINAIDDNIGELKEKVEDALIKECLSRE